MELDLDFVRSQFPAFSVPSLKGQHFFENAGGSYTCTQVIGRIGRFYDETKVQPYAPYAASMKAGRAMDEAYERLAAALNVGEDEVHLGPSSSQNTYVLAQAIRPLLTAGDEIIVTNQDHEANSGAWRRLAEFGVVVREWQVDPDTGRLDPKALDDLLGARTKLVAMPHCSNIVGHINPVADIAARAHAAGAILVVDGVSYAPHGLPDVSALGADIYFFSLYKTYGPHQGLMVVRREVMQLLANQSHWFNDGEVHKRLVPAGPDHAQVAAAAGVADYIDTLYHHHFGGSPAFPSPHNGTGSDGADGAERARQVHQLMRAQEVKLLTPLLEWLRGRNGIRVLGPTVAEERAPTVAIHTTRPADQIAAALGERGIMASYGHFYARRLVEALKVPSDPGVLRLSFVHYTNDKDMEALMKALDAEL